MSRRAGVISGSCHAGNESEIASGVCPASIPEHQDGYMSDWPLHSYLELGALPSAVPCARLHVKQVLWEWGFTDLAETAELVVSELVTNAQKAAAPLAGSWYNGQWKQGIPPIRLWLSSDKERILIHVWDGNDWLPRLQISDLLAESGRGLLLVKTLCATWGAYIPEGASGKIVWAELRVA